MMMQNYLLFPLWPWIPELLLVARATGAEGKSYPTSFEYVSEAKLLNFIPSLTVYLLINNIPSCFWYSTFPNA